MDLSVIIVCYKGWERLLECLEALDDFQLKSFSMEVIVVDNNSGDGRINDFESKFNRFRFIKSPINGGYAYGCNLGAAGAKGDVFMILNPDTIVREDAIGKLLEHTKTHPEYFIISCRQVGENGKEIRAAGKFPGISSGVINKRKLENFVSFPDWVSGSLMLTRKETFQNLNGFDESFWMYYEDVDICLRARHAGGEIAFYNDAEIKHVHGGSSRIDLKTTSITRSEVQISKHLFINKHLKGLKRIIFHILVVLDNLIIGLLIAVIGLISFHPKLFVRFLLLLRLVEYYAGSLYRGSWMSPRSVKFKVTNPL
jgi:GT2 family glycosyltransferase